MAPLDLHSETFPSHGGAAGQGIRRALGRPKLDPLSMLIREAVQNSWDARIRRKSAARVEFAAQLQKFSPAQAECLRRTVFSAKPKHHPLASQLDTQLGRLILQDRGTVGLTGPAFVESAVKADHRFIGFCRQFGRSDEDVRGGGTYGYGKAQYYLMSGAATIIVHTRSNENGSLLERLMGLSLWKADPNSLETGRHWWGVKDKQGRVGPVEGTQAASLATGLGFSKFSGDETGTSVMIVAPRFPVPWDVAGKCIAESMLIWFWPRMLGACDDEGTLVFDVSANEKTIPIPDPRRHVPIRLYADALRIVRERIQKHREPTAPAVVESIQCSHPKGDLGWIGLSVAARQEREPFAVTRIEGHVFADQIVSTDVNSGCTRHIALMRREGQVIRYLQVPPYPEPTMEYGGVFVAGDSRAVEEAFANSEPPSHDDWTPDDMGDDNQRRMVRTALREIRNIAQTFADAARPEPESESQDPLGAVSAELAELISADGTGPRPKSKGATARGGQSRGGPALHVLNEGTLRVWNGKRVFSLPFDVQLGSASTASITANIRVVIAGGGAESEAPRTGLVPTLIGWKAPDGKLTPAGILVVDASTPLTWEAIVDIPDDVMLGVSLHLQ